MDNEQNRFVSDLCQKMYGGWGVGRGGSSCPCLTTLTRVNSVSVQVNLITINVWKLQMPETYVQAHM